MKPTSVFQAASITNRRQSQSERRWPALDGLRGIAILLVFAFHLPLDVFRTGSFGVIVFFVLSGFLISTILLRELDATGTIRLARFFGRRAARLLPALMVLIAGHLVLQITVIGDTDDWWARTWPVLIYLSNLVMINGADLAHMSHTWSLAIEEHFYLIWPLILVMLPKTSRLSFSWGLVGLFGIWRLTLLWSGADNVRIFFASDTNAFAPLIGCALAVTLHERRLMPLTRHASIMSVASLVFVSTIPWEFTDRRLLYLALPVALLSAVAIWAALDTPTPLLEHPVLRWIGRISYGLYLWHFLLISLPWERWPVSPVLPMVLVSFAASIASYYLIERPILSWWHRREASTTAVEIRNRPALDSPPGELA